MMRLPLAAAAVLAALCLAGLCSPGAAAQDPPDEHREGPAEAPEIPAIFERPEFDFSRAGYHMGREDPPRLEPTLDITDYGAVEGGAEDCTDALKAALERASEEGGGVIRIPPGRWRLEREVVIRTPGTVIQGAGAGETVLVCPNSLSDLHGYDRRWSWSGAFISMRPPPGDSAMVADLLTDAETGDDRIVVRARDMDAPDTWPRPGETLEFLWYNDTGDDTLLDHLYGGVIPTGRMGREMREATGPRVREYVRVTTVESDKPGILHLTLAEPLRLDARTAWRCALRRTPILTECGVEGVTFEFPETEHPGHLKERGYNALNLSGTVDCWVRDVRTEFADSGIILGASRHCTIADVVLAGRTMHHPLSVSWGADNLFTRWRIEAPHVHGTTLSWSAHGNVYSKGWGNGLAMDCHRACSFRNLHSDITVHHGARILNVLRSGGSRPRGPHSARENVYWNIRHVFTAGDGPARLRTQPEWPGAIFAHWTGTRPLEFEEADGIRQHILGLNREAPVPCLHAHQRSAR